MRSMPPAVEIVDLHHVTSRQLAPLFQEEQRHWLDELHWDYRPSVQAISRFVDSHSLSGYAAISNGQAAGYAFYVVEESKGLIGGLYVSQRFPQLATAESLLSGILAALRAAPGLRRIEAQLMPFGPPLDPAFTRERFRLHTRQFMLLPLAQARLEATPMPEGLRIDPWDDRYFEECARLIQQAYAGHVDSEINDQYCSEAGATKFLKNIILLPGCGQFQPDASFVVRPQAADKLVGVVLTSSVSHGVGHTTQICVLPEHRGQRLGLRLMAASVRALKSRRFHALSLTVTAANRTAVTLYERLGFHTVKSFSAAVWQA
jgi:ribosomal protein S18 acetylase RimI-like enzyme